jgi:hypothetical protein
MVIPIQSQEKFDEIAVEITRKAHDLIKLINQSRNNFIAINVGILEIDARILLIM